MTDQVPPAKPTQVFADHVVDYSQAGWPCILPVPPTTKTPPPVGFTGAEGADTEPLQLVHWATSAKFAGYSIALRMPEGVIGIDVDEYDKNVTLPDGTTKVVHKTGAATLAAHEQQWGPLPATWSSTARGSAQGPGLSRIMLFRVPAQRYVTKLSGDVEIIQRHHRYAVVWPSPHESVGTRYQWYDPADRPVNAPPKPDELAVLPQAWVDGLAEGASGTSAASADRASGETLLDQLLDDWRPECADITSARLQAAEELVKADAGSRHDTMTARIHHLVQLAAGGHTGVAYAIAELRNAWAHLTAGEDRAGELERMLLTSARKAVTTVGVHQVPHDPCLMMSGTSVPGPAPATEDGEPIEPIAPPRWWSVRSAIGTQSFDPNAGTDQALGEKVLERMFPALRYTYDSGGWLLRAPECWEPHGRLSPWAVAQVATLAPVGDLTAEKGSEPHERAKRRQRLMSTAGARAIATKMDDLVAGGMHPAAMLLSELDSEPEILWAGGMPWSLRASTDGPVFADLDPATPHLQTAAVAPELVPTPLWDALLEAVWPDPGVRAWALRVLSIALTGYADRALPVLLGETGRGKTQVIALLMSVLGSYAHAANPKLLTAGSHEHDTIVFALKGRRLSFIDEAPSEAKAGQERLKQLTGGGELTARQMNQNPITFRPTHTFVLTANDEPTLTDPAVRARVRLIPCDGDPEAVRLTRAAIGHITGPAWRAEAPGVLANMMTEAAAWLADPSTAQVVAAPEHIRYLAEHLGAEQDPVSVWVTEETEPFEIGSPSRELYQAFVASCRRNSMRADAIPSETKWGRSLNRLGYPSLHTEHGKRRQLRGKSGGFLPGMDPVQTPSQSVGEPVRPTRQAEDPPQASTAPAPPPADGLGGQTDGLLTGSNGQPVRAFTQVNPSESVNPDGSDGLKTFPHIRETPPDTEIHGAYKTPQTRQSVREASEPADPTLEDQKPAPKPKRERSAAATQKAAELREEKRQVAIAEAAGAAVALPAVVTRDATIRECTPREAHQLLATITSTPAALTVDVEHTGYPVGHELFRLRTVQLGNEHFALVLDPNTADQADVVRHHLAAATQLHAHSATADLVPLVQAGLAEHDDVWAKMLDTGILAKLSDPASTGNDADLKSLSKAVLGDAAVSPRADEARKALFKAGKWLTETEVTTPIERSGWAQVDPGCSTMVRYAASDVLDDAALARLLPRPTPEVLERELAVQRMTARVTHHGIRLDGDHVQAKVDEHTAARAQYAEKVRAYGIDNPGSNPQVGEALLQLGAPLPRTATGKPSVAKGVLEPMESAPGQVGDLVRAVLSYRHHNTALVLLLEPYLELVTRGDGRARPTIFTLGADTGRMSSSRPNVQQVSREGGMRACFTADPGHLLVSADFASVEIRVAAALSQDPTLVQMVLDERDLHAEIARLVWGPDFTKAHRYKAKRKVFGRIYGQGVDGMARTDGAGHDVAQAVIDAMDSLTPGLTEWSRMVRDGVEAGRTQFQAYSGRVIHLPKAAPHAAPNYCIQGTARELLVDALLRWAETPWGHVPLFPVHDELVAIVPEDQAEAATAALVACMTTQLNGVPIVAEPSEPTFAWADSA